MESADAANLDVTGCIEDFICRCFRFNQLQIMTTLLLSLVLIFKYFFKGVHPLFWGETISTTEMGRLPALL